MEKCRGRCKGGLGAVEKCGRRRVVGGSEVWGEVREMREVGESVGEGPTLKCMHWPVGPQEPTAGFSYDI